MPTSTAPGAETGPLRTSQANEIVADTASRWTCERSENVPREVVHPIPTEEYVPYVDPPVGVVAAASHCRLAALEVLREHARRMHAGLAQQCGHLDGGPAILAWRRGVHGDQRALAKRAALRHDAVFMKAGS